MCIEIEQINRLVFIGVRSKYFWDSMMPFINKNIFNLKRNLIISLNLWRRTLIFLCCTLCCRVKRFCEISFSKCYLSRAWTVFEFYLNENDWWIRNMLVWILDFFFWFSCLLGKNPILKSVTLLLNLNTLYQSKIINKLGKTIANRWHNRIKICREIHLQENYYRVWKTKEYNFGSPNNSIIQKLKKKKAIQSFSVTREVFKYLPLSYNNILKYEFWSSCVSIFSTRYEKKKLLFIKGTTPNTD